MHLILIKQHVENTGNFAYTCKTSIAFTAIVATKLITPQGLSL